MNETVSTKICGHFAQILEYPTPSLQELTKECISLLDALHTEAADLLKRFNSYLDQTHLGQRKEIYTDAFEFQAPCFPNVEYHLIGENHRRALFMAGLREHYGIYDFSEGTELPDRLSVMLRSLAKEGEAERMEIIDWCIVPALKKMVDQMDGRTNPFGGCFRPFCSHSKMDGERR
jgi:nitrate reductase delta subunit